MLKLRTGAQLLLYGTKSVLVWCERGAGYRSKETTIIHAELLKRDVFLKLLFVMTRLVPKRPKQRELKSP